VLARKDEAQKRLEKMETEVVELSNCVSEIAAPPDDRISSWVGVTDENRRAYLM
jgi:hypothetical protein